MALPELHPISEVQLSCHSPSIGASAVVSAVRAPFRGKIVKVGAVTGGTITTTDALITVAIGVTNITGGAISISVSNASAFQHFSATPTALNFVNEDDVITFTPSLASGASIPGSFYAILRRG